MIHSSTRLCEQLITDFQKIIEYDQGYISEKTGSYTAVKLEKLRFDKISLKVNQLFQDEQLSQGHKTQLAFYFERIVERRALSIRHQFCIIRIYKRSLDYFLGITSGVQKVSEQARTYLASIDTQYLSDLKTQDIQIILDHAKDLPRVERIFFINQSMRFLANHSQIPLRLRKDYAEKIVKLIKENCIEEVKKRTEYLRILVNSFHNTPMVSAGIHALDKVAPCHQRLFLEQVIDRFAKENFFSESLAEQALQEWTNNKFKK